MNTIQHFTHPYHSLTEFFAYDDYRCDGCKKFGSGKRYRCHGCDFDLHEYCATCPYKLSSFMHPHQLTLLMRNTQGNQSINRVCRVCRDNIEGLFYWCNCENFDVHPMCTQLPETLSHVQHKKHLLKLEAPSKSNPCAVCSKRCDSWRYRCGECGFDIHLECVQVTCDQETKQRGSIPESSVPPPPVYYPPPPYGGYPYGYPYYAPSPSHNMYQNNWPPQQQPHQVVRAKRGGDLKGIFSVVAQIGLGTASQMIFGTDITSFF